MVYKSNPKGAENMIEATFSEYYGTVFQAWMWTSLYKQYEAADWQNEPWRNWREGSCHAHPIPAEPDDMTANPYRRYCQDRELPLGTQIAPVSRGKYVSAVVITASIESLRHLAGAIEALVRVPLSLALLLPFDRVLPRMLSGMFSEKVKEARRHLFSPKENITFLCQNVLRFLIFTCMSPSIIYNNTKGPFQNIGGLYKDRTNQRNYMDGTDIPLWKIYAESQQGLV